MPEQGTLELVGAGEFLEIMRDVNAGLLERAGGRRVAIPPTASAPVGRESLSDGRRWAWPTSPPSERSPGP